ncbi:MAG: LysM peptidoglycan-binding domain-containing protein [Alphaproteobacteria bacterium]|nr:LysM peptidoglycan-binding domain-containing protein [Alphaproteobacteria bacterium]
MDTPAWSRNVPRSLVEAVIRPSRLLLLLALCAGPAALADDAADGVRPAEAAGDDAIWSWIERLDGDVMAVEAEEASAEALTVELIERAWSDGEVGLDVPLDYYDDPARALAGDPLRLAELDLAAFDLPVEVNAHVEHWLEVLLGPGRRYFTRWLERKARFEHLVLAQLDEAGLPRDLLYLAMVESGFNPYAYSHAHAAGLWQFIPSTGRAYGLAIDFWLDERRDPEKATRAAIQMLSELHASFGDWWLAFAAYNTGPARVRRQLAAAEGEEVDYWDLVEQDLLHRETQGYVPKIIAAAILGHHPERYGFTGLTPQEPLTYETVRVEEAVDVAALATCAGLDEDTFRELNPALRRFAIPAGGVDLRVPVGAGDTFLERVAALPPEAKRSIVLHEVARGESLSVIAERYGVTVRAVADANRLRDAGRIAIGQQLVIPVPGRDTPPPARASVAAVSSSSAPSQATAPSRSAPAQVAPDQAAPPPSYTVRQGDTLSEIAERFRVPLDDLLSYNGLSTRSTLRVGQVLALRGGGTRSASSPRTQAAATYEVKSGDSLWSIAQAHDVSVESLQRWNGLGRDTTLRVGQKLAVTGGSTQAAAAPAHRWTTYVVRAGDSLGAIAQRHGVSVAELQSWNELRGTTIHPGDRLKIRRRGPG